MTPARDPMHSSPALRALERAARIETQGPPAVCAGRKLSCRASSCRARSPGPVPPVCPAAHRRSPGTAAGDQGQAPSEGRGCTRAPRACHKTVRSAARQARSPRTGPTGAARPRPPPGADQRGGQGRRPGVRTGRTCKERVRSRRDSGPIAAGGGAACLALASRLPSRLAGARHVPARCLRPTPPVKKGRGPGRVRPALIASLFSGGRDWPRRSAPPR